MTSGARRSAPVPPSRATASSTAVYSRYAASAAASASSSDANSGVTLGSGTGVTRGSGATHPVRANTITAAPAARSSLGMAPTVANSPQGQPRLSTAGYSSSSSFLTVRRLRAVVSGGNCFQNAGLSFVLEMPSGSDW
ncbi:hypothetical protein BH09ACT5_BH09ACT5_00690 [soil metagenome]